MEVSAAAAFCEQLRPFWPSGFGIYTNLATRTLPERLELLPKRLRMLPERRWLYAEQKNCLHRLLVEIFNFSSAPWARESFDLDR